MILFHWMPTVSLTATPRTTSSASLIMTLRLFATLALLVANTASPAEAFLHPASVIASKASFSLSSGSGSASTATTTDKATATRHFSAPTRLAAFETVGQVVDAFYHTQPYTAAFLTCSVKASAADVLAQQQQPHQQQQLDASRNLGFLVYGGLYQGLCQQFLYSHVFPTCFGEGDVIGSVVTDMAFIAPFLCLPTAYVFKSLFTSSSSNSNDTGVLSAQTVLTQGLEQYRHDVMEQQLLQRYWMIWGPVQCFTFGVVPVHYRVVVVAAVSFVWTYVLSMVSSGDDDSAKQQPSESTA